MNSKPGAMSWAKFKRVHKIFRPRQYAAPMEQAVSPLMSPIVKDREVIYVLPSLSTISSPLLSDSTWRTFKNGDSHGHSECDSEFAVQQEPSPSQSLPRFEGHVLHEQILRSVINFPCSKLTNGHPTKIEDSFQMIFSHLTLLDIESPAAEILSSDDGRRKKAESNSQANMFSLPSMPQPDYLCTTPPSEHRLPHIACQSDVLPSVFEDDSGDEECDHPGLKKALMWIPRHRSRLVSRSSLVPRSRLSRYSTASSSSLGAAFWR